MSEEEKLAAQTVVVTMCCMLATTLLFFYMLHFEVSQLTTLFMLIMLITIFIAVRYFASSELFF